MTNVNSDFIFVEINVTLSMPTPLGDRRELMYGTYVGL